MSLVAEVLPQVVGALQAFDPYERGVALNQLAQVKATSSCRAGGAVQRHITPALNLLPLAPHVPSPSLAAPGACSPGPLHAPCMRTACALHVMYTPHCTCNMLHICIPHGRWSEPNLR